MSEPIRVTRGGVLTPEWGNSDREEAEKIRVHYRFLSFAEQQALIRYEDLGKTMAFDSRQIASMVTKVDNLTIVDEAGNEARLTTGQQIIDEPGTEGLCLELWARFRTMTTVDKKKSPLASSFGPVEKQEPSAEFSETPESRSRSTGS